MRPVPVEAVQRVNDQESFLRFLREDLGWKIQDDLKFADLTYEWFPDDFEFKPESLRGSHITQLRPFVKEQPWGIFILQLGTPRLYVSELRKILRGLNPAKRKPKDHPTWPARNLMFICTPDWKNYTFARFEGDTPEKAKLFTFGWEYQSTFVRTLCEFNIRQLQFPEQENMFGLDPKVWVDQWSSAFDVKPVTDKFYREYDGVFTQIKKFLANQFGLTEKLLAKDFDSLTKKQQQADEDLHLFVQNLVNRLMFLKFLEKRGWLDYNRNYLADLYSKAKSKDEDFYKKYLFYVFFAGLNHQVQEFKIAGDGAVSSKNQFARDLIGVLPFLNGGLFEKDTLDETVAIPNDAFDVLFELFNRYNFTITEDTPLDVEVAVNPEMLGKVFEESVIARKEKGAYYTPRNIVSFMCRESVKNCLKSRCDIVDVDKKIDSLIDNHSSNMLEEKDSLEVYRVLSTLRVLDPAVGSGAFIVGMMFEMLQVYKVIGEKLERDHPFIVQNRLANPTDVYKLKKQIIQNSLFGVDIEEFAINIARLRLWLSLAVDFPINFKDRDDFVKGVNNIDPLPNLLYKLKRGDSLVAKYHTVSMEPHGKAAGGELVAGRKERITSSVVSLAKLKAEFFTESDSLRKDMIGDQIASEMRGMVLAEIEILKRSLRIRAGQGDLFGLGAKQKREHQLLKEKVLQLESVEAELRATKGLPPDFPVIWDVDFSEVLEEGGFDVVIANPPYVRQEDVEDKEELALRYDVHTGTSDLYTYFYERGIKLLKLGGTISFISSNKFFRAGYGLKLRQFLKERTSLHVLIDFNDTPVFEATTYPCVLIATKDDKGTKNTFRGWTLKSEEELKRFEELFRNQAIEMRQSDLQPDAWRIESQGIKDLIGSIGKAGRKLEQYVEGLIYRGIITGYNNAFIIRAQEKEELIASHKESAEVIKPLLTGRDIHRYTTREVESYLIYVPHQWTNTHKGKKSPEAFFKSTYPSVYRHLKQIDDQDQLTKRDDQGDYWWEMRPCKYLKQFEKGKIVWGNLGDVASFTYDFDNHYLTAPACIIPTDELWLLGLLNSKLGDYFFHQIAAIRRGGYLEYKPMYVSQLPVADAAEEQKQMIGELVQYVLHLRNKNSKPVVESVSNDHVALTFEELIDGCMFELYFREHMHERQINVLELAKSEIVPISNLKNAKEKEAVIASTYMKLRESDSEIRNRILLFGTRSPETLLPIIRGT